jgi:tetratricopeptide (TPR) repeat protein
LLAAVTGMPAAQLQSRLWSLEILDFLVESRWLASPEYEFAHDLIREVAYDSILRSQREQLHRQILTALEAGCPGREEDVAEALCHHAVKAQEWAKADHYGQLAARKAFARSAFRDASGYFQIAMDAVDKLPASTAHEQRAIDLRIEARLSFAALGNIEQWFGLCRDAEARSEKISDERRRLASITIRAAALNFYGTPYEAVTAGERAVALANELTEMSWLGFAEYGLGQAYFVAGRYRDAEACLNRAIARFVNAPEKVPPGTTGSSLLILCYMMKAVIYVSIGEFDESQQSSSRASDLAQTSGRPYDLIAAGYSRGVVQTFQGNLEEAEGILDETASLSRQSEVRLFLPLVLCALGNLYLQTGRPVDAREVLLRAKDEAEALGHAASTVLASVYLASAYAHLGDIVRGIDLARACQAGAKQKGYQGLEASALFAEASILFLQGASAATDAIAKFERTIEIAAGLEARPLLGSAKGTLARLLANSGRKAEAREELVQAIALFARSKMTIQVERAKATLSKVSDL